ncbi:hypothetical protein DRO35_05580, partial [Candidatus Bathyarchaeota archaeon]
PSDNSESEASIWSSPGASWCNPREGDILSFSGITPTGSWTRPDRGFRFRVVGWGDVEWKRVITALVEVGYDYVLSYEHEDPVMSREDGCEKCIAFLKPLIIKAPLKKVWW